MYYVTLGNLGLCTPNNADPGSCTAQTGWGLSNTSLLRTFADTYLNDRTA